MKQYTDKDQTARLIELGFPFPKRVIGVRDVLGLEDGKYKIDFENAYSIGELIEFLEHRIYRIENDMQWLVDGVRVYKADTELINALFEACVTLKEEGVI